MADTTSRNEGGLSGKSYKDKLLQPSDQDELSVPDLPETPTVPPTEDEGSPPMTVPVEAPAGADESTRQEPHSKGASTAETTYTAPIDSKTGEGKGANQIPVPDTSDVTAVAGTELSDVEKEAIEDPSTADLLAAATADDSAAAAANDAPVPTNVVTMKEDGTSEVPAAAARGKKVGTSSDRTAAAAAAGGGTAAAECDLQHSMSILTASDAAAFGLANLESQLDSGKGYSRPGSSCSSRSGSVMSRSETGNIIDFTSPAAARDTLPDHMLESVESGNAADDQSVPATAAAAAGGSGNTDPADFGVAAAYGHLQQAPAAADDPAAVPAAADLPPGSSSNDGSSDVAAGPTKVKSAKLPTEPAVSADKDEEVVSDAAAGGTGAAAAEPEAGSSENPLAAAVEAVAQPVAAALTNLKDVFIGPDIKLGGDSESTQDKKE